LEKSERPKSNETCTDVNGAFLKNIKKFGFSSTKTILRTKNVEKFEKVLIYLRDSGESASRSAVSVDVFSKNMSAAELDEILDRDLTGLVYVNKAKKWVLTGAGRALSNKLTAQAIVEEKPVKQEPISGDFARFKQLAAENPDSSPQRLLQLAGRHLGDPLDPAWADWRAKHPEWYLAQPKDWYAADVELDERGYPMRCPSNPLTAKERDTRPKTDRGWFDWAMRQPGASLEPLAKAMPAFECANILRVLKKVGMGNAIDIFGVEKIAKAHEAAGITPENLC
jgi:hypothetical protein